jgi:hypothetical protein
MSHRQLEYVIEIVSGGGVRSSTPKQIPLRA